MTALTKEVNVYVFIVLATVTATQFIPHSIASVLDYVYEVVLFKRGQRPEYIRFIDRQDTFFQFGHRHRSVGRGQSSCDNNSVGCGFNAVPDQHLCAFLVVHTPVLLRSNDRCKCNRFFSIEQVTGTRRHENHYS